MDAATSSLSTVFRRWLVFLLLAGGIAFGLSFQKAPQSADPLALAERHGTLFLRAWRSALLESAERSRERSQRWLDQAKKELPPSLRLQEAYLIVEQKGGMFAFLKKKVFWAHLDAKKQGQALQKDSEDDKSLFDLSAEAEQKSKEAADLLLKKRLSSLRSTQLILPIRSQDTYLGTAFLRIAWPATAQAAQGSPWLLSWLLASLLVGIFLLLIRGRWGHLAALTGLAAVALYPYVWQIDTQGRALQAQKEAEAAYLTHLLTASPQKPSARWLRRIFPEEAKAKKLSFVFQPAESTKPARIVAIKDLAAAQAPISLLPFFWAALLGIAAYMLYAIGFLTQTASLVRLHLLAYLYISPAMLGMLMLVFIPFVVGIGLSFFRYTSEGAYLFVGLQNFRDILFSQLYPFPHALNFYFTLLITILWTASNVLLHVTLGLSLALLLKSPLLRMKEVYRILLILPWAIPNYITALIWKGMFHQQFGAINALLVSCGLERVSWFSSASTAFSANLITNTWLGFPFMMVVSLGALQSIPSDLYEAADVDGAGRWQKFWYITLPLLKPALFPAIILGSIWTFNMFNIIYLVSGGEPGGATDILITEAYRWAFQRGYRYGYAAAYSTIIFLILLAYSLTTNRLTKATEGI